ncbi:DUF2628 domain-containing protein [Xanthobacter sp. TB0139]|uniref:DUF2628 domain-containing protein n=1 Tax=Xanthobacter sp. TB0139 TaxID=3459178 RepID=UPI004039466B
MSSWIVLSRTNGKAAGKVAPHTPAQQAAQAAEDVVFVRDSFSWLTLLFTPVMLLWHRLWLGLAVYVAATILVNVSSGLANLPEDVPGLAMLGISLLFAFELSTLRLRKLERHGYEEEAVITAPNREMAERRFFKYWDAPPSAPPPAPRRAMQPASASADLPAMSAPSPASATATSPRPAPSSPQGAAEPYVIGSLT